MLQTLLNIHIYTQVKSGQVKSSLEQKTIMTSTPTVTNSKLKYRDTKHSKTIKNIVD